MQTVHDSALCEAPMVGKFTDESRKAMPTVGVAANGELCSLGQSLLCKMRKFWDSGGDGHTPA